VTFVPILKASHRIGSKIR